MADARGGMKLKKRKPARIGKQKRPPDEGGRFLAE
jgi:hypothetical protein